MNVTVESNTVSDGDLYSYSNENTVDKGNHMKYYHGVYDAGTYLALLVLCLRASAHARAIHFARRRPFEV